MICWTFRQNVALGLRPRATFCLQVQHIICCPHHQSIIIYCYTLISFSLYNLYTKKSPKKTNVLSSGHKKINVGPRAYKNICWTGDVTFTSRLTSQASRFVLNPLFPKPIRPKLCQFVGRNLDNVDRCDGVRVYSH